MSVYESVLNVRQPILFVTYLKILILQYFLSMFLDRILVHYPLNQIFLKILLLESIINLTWDCLLILDKFDDNILLNSGLDVKSMYGNNPWTWHVPRFHPKPFCFNVLYYIKKGGVLLYKILTSVNWFLNPKTPHKLYYVSVLTNFEGLVNTIFLSGEPYKSSVTNLVILMVVVLLSSFSSFCQTQKPLTL